MSNDHNMYSSFNHVKEGWLCPTCKRVYAPTTAMCLYCPGVHKGASSNTSNWKPSFPFPKD
jgi:uncharacterized OB-fold protein